jgi:hypothetical protein
MDFFLILLLIGQWKKRKKNIHICENLNSYKKEEQKRTNSTCVFVSFRSLQPPSVTETTEWATQRFELSCVSWEKRENLVICKSEKDGRLSKYQAKSMGNW